MAYLILEDDTTGNESAYFEFNPENEASLVAIERFLTVRRTLPEEGIEQLAAVADESLMQKCECRQESPVAPLRSLVRNLFTIHRQSRRNRICRCKNRINSAALTSGVTSNSFSLVS